MNSCGHFLRHSRWVDPGQMLRHFATTVRARTTSIGKTVSLLQLPELPKSEGPSRALIRAPDLLLREKVLGTEDATDPTSLVLLSGSRGSGKSTSLRSAVSTARKSGCIVLYIPNASEWTHGGGFFVAARGMGDGPKDDELPVKWYDRPFQTSKTLKTLLNSHASEMEAVPCGEHGTARSAAEEAIETVKNVDDNWRTMPRRAGVLFSAVVESLATDENTRFVVAIDQYENLTGLTSLGNGRGRWVHASSISAMGRHFGRDAIRRFADSMRNGVVVLAQSGYSNGRRIRASRVLGTEDYEIREEVRKDANGVEWLEEMWMAEEKGKDVVEFEKFTMKEMQTIMEIEEMRTKSGAKGSDSDIRERVALLAGGRGDVLRKLIGSM